MVFIIWPICCHGALTVVESYILATVQANREMGNSFQQQAHITYQPQETTSSETEVACQLVLISSAKLINL